MLQYSNFVTSMRHIIIIIVLLFQARCSHIELELELKLRLEVELKLEWGDRDLTGAVSLLWQPVGNVAPTCPAGKRCGEWLIKS